MTHTGRMVSAGICAVFCMHKWIFSGWPAHWLLYPSAESDVVRKITDSKDPLAAADMAWDAQPSNLLYP